MGVMRSGLHFLGTSRPRGFFNYIPFKQTYSVLGKESETRLSYG